MVAANSDPDDNPRPRVVLVIPANVGIQTLFASRTS